MSSGSESDEEYMPGEPEQVSEEESADDETDQQYDKELEHKAKKRKATPNKKAGKKKCNGKTEVVKPEGTVEESEKEVDPEAEKKRADDLWAMFLEGTDTKPKNKSDTKLTNNPNNTAKSSSDTDKLQPINTNKTATIDNDKQKAQNDKEKERKIFEFAGETIVVENNVIKEKIKTSQLPDAVKNDLIVPSQSKKSGGLSSVLGKINQKSKLSTLEKSKLDWQTYKQQEGIEDEIKSHNKGKEGYLDRQDFLERADLRQFEIERELRMSRRSNR